MSEGGREGGRMEEGGERRVEKEGEDGGEPVCGSWVSGGVG